MHFAYNILGRMKTHALELLPLLKVAVAEGYSKQETETNL